MNVTSLRLVAMSALLLAGAAHAQSQFQSPSQYRCAQPDTAVDRRACDAAREGPDALRHFVQRMNWLHHHLQFGDYVNDATQLAWDQQRARATAKAAPARGDVRTGG